MERAEAFDIETVETLELINDPTRMRLLHIFAEPHTVKEAADKLGVPVTRLYYHVNLLDEHGLIAVAHTEKAGAMIKRYFQTVAQNFRPGPGLIENADDHRKAAEIAVATVFDGARLDAEAALEHHFAAPDDELVGTIGRAFYALTADQAERWSERLVELIEEMNEESMGPDDDGADLYSFTYAFFPARGLMGGV